MANELQLFVPQRLDPDTVSDVLRDLNGVNVETRHRQILLEGTPEAYVHATLSVFNADDPSSPIELRMHHGAIDPEVDDRYPEGTDGTFLFSSDAPDRLNLLRSLQQNFGGHLTSDGGLDEFEDTGVMQRDMRS